MKMRYLQHRAEPLGRSPWGKARQLAGANADVADTGPASGGGRASARPDKGDRETTGGFPRRSGEDVRPRGLGDFALRGGTESRGGPADVVSFDDRGRMWVIQYLQYPVPAGLKPVEVDQYLRTV